MSKSGGLFLHAVQLSVCGCEGTLSLCLYLQMHTFERTGSLFVPLCNWCWHMHGDKPMQSAARTEVVISTVRYRYVCSVWRPRKYCVFYNSTVYDIVTAGLSLITKPPLDHIVNCYNSAQIFMTFSLILHSITCCSQIQPIIIILIFKDLCSDLKCFPRSVHYISLLAFQH